MQKLYNELKYNGDILKLDFGCCLVGTSVGKT
jgi:hypothetical protein